MAVDAPSVVEADVLAEVLSAGQSTMSTELAQWLLTLHFTEVQQHRVQILADKGNEGTLTEAERLEVEKYRRVGNILSLLQSKARLALKRSGRSAN